MEDIAYPPHRNRRSGAPSGNSRARGERPSIGGAGYCTQFPRRLLDYHGHMNAAASAARTAIRPATTRGMCWRDRVGSYTGSMSIPSSRSGLQRRKRHTQRLHPGARKAISTIGSGKPSNSAAKP